MLQFLYGQFNKENQYYIKNLALKKRFINQFSLVLIQLSRSDELLFKNIVEQIYMLQINDDNAILFPLFTLCLHNSLSKSNIDLEKYIVEGTMNYMSSINNQLKSINDHASIDISNFKNDKHIIVLLSSIREVIKNSDENILVKVLQDNIASSLFQVFFDLLINIIASNRNHHIDTINMIINNMKTIIKLNHNNKKAYEEKLLMLLYVSSKELNLEKDLDIAYMLIKVISNIYQCYLNDASLYEINHESLAALQENMISLHKYVLASSISTSDNQYKYLENFYQDVVFSNEFMNHSKVCLKLLKQLMKLINSLLDTYAKVKCNTSSF